MSFYHVYKFTFSAASSGFYIACSEDSGCILRISFAFWLKFTMSKVLSSFHGVIFIWLHLITWVFSFSCKMHAWHIYRYPTIMHLISSLFVYLTLLLMLIWALQTIYSHLHLINAKYVQNLILWVTVCLLFGFFFQNVRSGIMLLLPQLLFMIHHARKFLMSFLLKIF